MIIRPWNTATNHLRYKSGGKHLREVAQVRKRSVDPAVGTSILFCKARETSIYFRTCWVCNGSIAPLLWLLKGNGRYQD